MTIPTGEQWTSNPVRMLTADDLGIGVAEAVAEHASNEPSEPPLDDDHPLLMEVRRLLGKFGGIIFSGPPGTSKSYFAAKISHALTEGTPTQRRFVQFHPSYQYEDFIQGFAPKADGSGFEMRDSHFVLMCRAATENPTHTYVLVIDELSRGDPGRVFGEALTYVEHSKRGMPFSLASGTTLTVPPNLVILATMNPNDRGVDEVDAAFERRFARIAMDPDSSILASMASDNGMDPVLAAALVQFFNMVNGKARSNPALAVGHTYFNHASTVGDLKEVWDYQLRFLFERALRLDRDDLDSITNAWERVLTVPANPTDTAVEGGDGQTLARPTSPPNPPEQ